MKVLYLTNIPAPYRVDFFNALGEMCELTVLYEREYAKNRNSTWLENKAIYFQEVFLKSIKVGTENSLSLSVLKWLDDKRYDIILIGGYSTLTGMLAVICLKARKKAFILNSDGGFIKKDGSLRFFIKRYFISSAHDWLSTSKITDDYLVHYGAIKSRIYRYPFTSIRKAHILTEPPSEHEKRQMKEALKINYDYLVISVGQFIYRKGFDILIKAAEKLHDKIGVYIIGGKPTKAYCDIVEAADIRNVHFIDFMSGEALRKFYLAADVFVLPTREDIWGLVINEAMSYGLPIITTNQCIAGLELVRQNKNGYIVPVNDAEAIADSINALHEDNKKSDDMARNSLANIKNYTIEAMAIKHIEIFEKVLGGTRCM